MNEQDPNWQDVLQVDNRLFDLVKEVDILDAVAPLNYRDEKAAFLAAGGTTNPKFCYAPRDFDLYKRKRELFNLPVDALADDDLAGLYTDVVESYVDKLDQFRSIGSGDFLYDSLRYYGEPSDKDIRNANFILHLPITSAEQPDVILDAREIVARFESFATEQGYQYELQLNDSMIANALVSGNVIKINGAAKVPETEVNALAHHELGVHLVTTLNARAQPLKILTMGCPVNTTTQEGLAILCEYLAGYMTLPRLRVLALRVVAVNSMLKDRDFKRTFALLKEQHKTPDELAFTITARVYRGGGFTKDYLYLQGFHQMLNAYENRADFNNLLCGKVAVEYLPAVTRLIEKSYLNEPGFISPAIVAPQDIDEVSRFIAHAIK